jgi:predicted hydrocarbon binding protein
MGRYLASAVPMGSVAHVGSGHLERQCRMTSDVQTKDIGGAQYYCSNRITRTYLLALEDVVGKNGINALLNQAGLRQRISKYPPDNLDLGWSFEEISALSQALEQVYGSEDGRDVASRAGQAWFHHALKDIGAVMGVVDLAFRVLPSGTKIKLGLNAMAETLSKTGDQIVRVEEKKDHLLYQIHRCPECWGRTARVSICHANLGLVREGLRWVTGGKSARVEEVDCIAKGDPSCIFAVDRRSTG